MNGIEFHKKDRYMWAFDRKIVAWSDVRNELNGKRGPGEKAVYSELANGKDGEPYMPRTFPIGQWHVTGIVAHPDQIADHYLYPFFIQTDAHQPVEIWTVDAHGRYLHGTGKAIEDYGYGNHFSDSLTTLGCIRDASEADLRWVVGKVQLAMRDHLVIPFNVVE